MCALAARKSEIEERFRSSSSVFYTRMQPEVGLQLMQCSRRLQGKAEEPMVAIELMRLVASER